VGEEEETGLIVRIVPPLRIVPEGVVRIGDQRIPPGVECGSGEDVLAPVQSLNHASLRVEGVEDARGSGLSGEETVRAPHVERRHRSRRVQFQYGRIPIINVIGFPGRCAFPGSQIVAVVPHRHGRSVGGQVIFGVEAERDAFVCGWIAISVEGECGVLVVRVEGVRGPFEGYRVLRSVVAEIIHVAVVARRGLVEKLVARVVGVGGGSGESRIRGDRGGHRRAVPQGVVSHAPEVGEERSARPVVVHVRHEPPGVVIVVGHRAVPNPLRGEPAVRKISPGVATIDRHFLRPLIDWVSCIRKLVFD